MAKQLDKSIKNWLPMICVLPAFFIFGSISIYSSLFIFPLINGLLLTLLLFVKKGKYRLYAITFAAPISALLSVKGWNIGSFLTWNIVIYIIVLFIESIVAQKQWTSSEIGSIIAYLVLFFYCFIVQVANKESIPKFFSSSVYWALPLLYILDNKAEKDVWALLVFLGLSHLLSNLFLCFFIYVLPSQAVTVLQRFAPSYVKMYEKFGSSLFRFPGFSGDPNHLGASVLLSGVSLFSYSLVTKKHRLVSFLLAISIQAFGLLGGSKAYLVTLIIAVLIIGLALIVKSQNKILCISLLTLSFLFASIAIMSIDSLSKTVARLIMFDDRQGFLESITTSRVSIWKTDISFLLSHPIRLLFGNGTWSKTMYGAAAHNCYIQSIWDLGFLGSVFFFYYMSFFFKKKSNNLVLFWLSIIVVAVYAFSLHLLYNECVLSIIGIMYCIFSVSGQKTKGEKNGRSQQMELLL